jgi:metallophosphoesterase (TIGR00282 family)
MELKILCVGDVVGSPGRRVMAEGVAHYVREEGVDFVVANAENVASGSGLTSSLHDKILAAGVDVITMGDHVYRRREIVSVLERSDRVVRPANFPPGAPGREVAIGDTQSGHRVAVISLLGRLFMKPMADCLFRTVDRVLAGLPRDVRIAIVDVHAEATSEKVALGWHLDGRVSVIFGTHTHVQTADERVLPAGTAYITDLGMTGAHDSVLGRRKDRVLSAMRNGVPTPFEVADGDPQMCGILVTVDPHTGKARTIERIRFRGSTTPAGLA